MISFVSSVTNLNLELTGPYSPSRDTCVPTTYPTLRRKLPVFFWEGGGAAAPDSVISLLSLDTEEHANTSDQSKRIRDAQIQHD